MKIIALGSGTSQGVPLIGCNCVVCQSDDPRDQRLRSSVYIESEQAKLLIDIGPDFRTQFIQNNLHTLDLILITHEHNDHIIGLDEVRAINFTQKKSIPLYAEKRVLGEIKTRFAYAFAKDPFPGLPQIELHEIDESAFVYKDLNIVPIRIQHGRLPILGYRINDFAYITDGSRIDAASIEKLQGLDILIINALRESSHYSHFTLQESLQYIEKINPKSAYITHVSHNMGLYDSWAAKLPEKVRPLEDKLILYC